ncbi:hypothetical protein SKAU_G00035800 [Synaphobranchus kaupii]|uniref:Uncharacterized protein n=1 Tax=Synaphobranchus kaupii TaxID=118154 RepID=A0A9Q1GGX8_SYNKA|nr:hypothetical protein SKAU_G00035800 [Synaphobranchus kaupii]
MDIRKFFSVANKTENYVSPEKTGEVAGAVLQSPEIVSEKDKGRVLNLPPPLPTCYTETVSEDEGRPPPPACTPSTDCTAAKVPSDLGRLLSSLGTAPASHPHHPSSCHSLYPEGRRSGYQRHGNRITLAGLPVWPGFQSPRE